MSRFENSDPFEPWNSYDEDNPTRPWNDPMYKDDPSAPWNNPMSSDYEKDRYAREHGIRREDMK